MADNTFTTLQVLTLDGLTQYDGLLKNYIDQADAAVDAKSLKTVALDGHTLKFYNVAEPVGSTTPKYSIELPETDLSALMPKFANATAGNIVIVNDDKQTAKDSGVALADLAKKADVDAKDAELKGSIDAVTAKVTTLIGEDANKSAREIALEELTKQLVPENAKESLNTLQEISAWIQGHPDDVAGINLKIKDLEDLIGKLPEGITATTVVGYIAEVKAALETAIATAKTEAITTAAADATTKADAVQANAKAYTDAELAKDRARLDAAEKDVADIEESLGETGAIGSKIKANTEAVTKAQKTADESKATAAAAQKTADESKAKAEENAAEIVTLKTSVDAVTATANTNKDDIATLKGEVKDLQDNAYDDTELRGLVTANTNDITQLKAKDTEIEGKVTANETAISAAADKIAAAEGEIDTLQADNATNKEDIAGLKTDTAAVTAKANQNADKIAALEALKHCEAIPSETIAGLFSKE